MKGEPSQYNEQEQQLREFVAVRRAEFALRQKIEKQRWERDVLAPAVTEFKAQITAGTATVLELPDAS